MTPIRPIATTRLRRDHIATPADIRSMESQAVETKSVSSVRDSSDVSKPATNDEAGLRLLQISFSRDQFAESKLASGLAVQSRSEFRSLEWSIAPTQMPEPDKEWSRELRQDSMRTSGIKMHCWPGDSHALSPRTGTLVHESSRFISAFGPTSTLRTMALYRLGCGFTTVKWALMFR
ncbi:hypothetical protein AC579_9999 [Pseudocercospora musae]|uniref:Uncharacterized protein n=1 Tax=Pseudocercospora musae TaxID=113226 RepID=A0A139I4S7_9PEZI|nr:hypothetical protein AC579_9999 [Pseudocercospora musae]